MPAARDICILGKTKIMIFQSIPIAIGTPQIILIVVVLLLLFGAKKIPELMKGLGSGIKEFKNASAKDIEEGEQQQKKE